MIDSIYKFFRTGQEWHFITIAFGFTWIIWIPFLLSGQEGFSLFITLGSWGPSLAAFIILYRREGKPGLKALITKITIWRVSPLWYVIVLCLPAAITGGTLFTFHVADQEFHMGVVRSALPGESFLTIPAIFLVNILIGGPLAEEFGWRGYLVPRITATRSLFTSGILVGILWVLWHAPLFIFGSQNSVVGGIPFVWYLPLITGFSVMFVYLYHGTGGSILLCVMFHASINTFISMLSLANFPELAFAVATILIWISVGVLAMTQKTEREKTAGVSLEKAI